MQTFLPYPCFFSSMSCLDYRRLGKQRIEAKQIINILEEKAKPRQKSDGSFYVPWSNHPAVKMWEGYVPALKGYYNVCLNEWSLRGYKNNMVYYTVKDEIVCPPWFGDKDFHDSHKSNLLRKKPEYYKKLWPDIPDNLPYIWPNTKEIRNGKICLGAIR